jgi:hypothetical protein
MVFLLLFIALLVLLSFCADEFKGTKPPLTPASLSGLVTRDAIDRMAKAHTTDFFVKEFIIVTRGKTHVWWKAKGVMDYELYKIAYHTGDTVYFNGDKVLYVVDVNGKQWR